MRKYIVPLFVLVSISFMSVEAQERDMCHTELEVDVDTLLKVEYKLRDVNIDTTPAYFVNGEHVASIHFIKPQDIDSIKVKKEFFRIKDQEYYGRIDIQTKKGCVLMPISLTDLKIKHTNLGTAKALFFIDGDFINEDYDEYLVNEADLLRIYVETSVNRGLSPYIIKILTKTDANIQGLKNPTIYIKGS